jgi:hypothetical protein
MSGWTTQKRERKKRGQQQNVLQATNPVNRRTFSQRQAPPCRYFVLGTCRMGHRCQFPHTSNSVPTQPSLEVQPRQKAVPTQPPTVQPSRQPISSPRPSPNLQTSFDPVLASSFAAPGLQAFASQQTSPSTGWSPFSLENSSHVPRPPPKLDLSVRSHTGDVPQVSPHPQSPPTSAFLGHSTLFGHFSSQQQHMTQRNRSSSGGFF